MSLPGASWWFFGLTPAQHAWWTESTPEQRSRAPIPCPRWHQLSTTHTLPPPMPISRAPRLAWVRPAHLYHHPHSPPPPGHVLKAVGTHGRLALTEDLVAGPGQVLGRDGVPYPALPWPSGTSSVENCVSSPTAPPPPDSQFSDHSWHGGGHWCTTHVGAGPPGYGAGLTALWHHVGSI